MYFLTVQKDQLCHTIVQGAASFFNLGIAVSQKLQYLL